ncbi:hypothetical protein B0H34DRAFT_732399 [Crassisporium funariophilum]|nr:hypothetical protein B0H34DRAFT_732399 [Crassisporium funariophilum]
MLQLDSFFAWVSVDERELTEYSVEYSEDYMSASCWIASEEGKSFVINWRDIVRTHDSMGRTSVDGVRCGLAKGINRKGYKKDIAQERDTAQQMGVATSSSTDRLLVFSKIDMTDDDLYLHSHMPRIFGEIRLEVSYVEKGPRQELELKPYKVENKIHERAKSLTQHHTKLGNSVETQKKPAHSVKVKGPLRVFIFKYRPLEVLKAMGIVPLEGEQLRVMAARTREIIDLTMDDGDDIMVPATDDERERTVSHDAQEIVRESQVVSKQQSPIKEGKLPKWKLEVILCVLFQKMNSTSSGWMQRKQRIFHCLSVRSIR